jgi:two-component system secretion system sensor histidine kinase SalK
MVIDGAYIQFINLKENAVLSQFSNLLLIASWQFLFTFDHSQIFYLLEILLSIIILYKTVHFLFMFCFQDSTYTYKKQTNFVLKIICVMTFSAKLINDRIFAILFLIQWLLSFTCCVFLFWIHRKRTLFIIKSEKKHLLSSFAIVLIPFITYVFMFWKKPEYVDSLGSYLMIIIPLFSIHNIAFKIEKR